MNILVVNAGSSSIKSVLYQSNGDTIDRIVERSVMNIGQPRATIESTIAGSDRIVTESHVPDHDVALQSILDMIANTHPVDTIDTIAYRVVYGGTSYHQPTVITDDVLADLASFAPIDPEHAPVTLHIITRLRMAVPNARHIACFDTSFFHNIPAVAQIVPIPRKYRDLGIRRFGYHGLSYDYLVNQFELIAGTDAKNGRVIYAHLGSGASMAATVGGSPVDMTMGLTPASGLVMGTRSGDIDPSLSWILHHAADMSADEYQHMINHESGLLAVSELSSDMYALLQSESTNTSAAQAVELFCYQAKKSIGALAATIGGIDSLVFAGGMGEQSAEIRQRICSGLEFLGIVIDDERNIRRDRLISAEHSRVGVHVIPTDESQSIARSIITMDTQSKETQ